MIMEYCLGDGNVNIVAPKELMETNNAYVSGSQLVVAEEMKIKGHNRFDAANALKPKFFCYRVFSKILMDGT
jgi:hypothetical protein